MQYKGLKIREVKMGNSPKAKMNYQSSFPAKFFSEKQVSSGLLTATNLKSLINKIDRQIKYWGNKKK